RTIRSSRRGTPKECSSPLARAHTSRVSWSSNELPDPTPSRWHRTSREERQVMREYLKFYIDGQWVDPVELKTLNVINPATEQVGGKIALGSAADVDRAVKAARRAFATWSQTTREERLNVLQRIGQEYQKRTGDLAAAITEEMGAPTALANGFQVGLGIGHLN